MNIKVKDTIKSCLTRNRGKDFFCKMSVIDADEYYFDFSGIKHVSTSFLDESIWKLVEMGKTIKIYDPDNVVINQLFLIEKWKSPAFRIMDNKPLIEFAA